MVKMEVAQKTIFSISDRLAKLFGVSGEPMEHNSNCKVKTNFFYKLGHFSINGPRLFIHIARAIDKDGRIKARQRTVAREMHDKLNLHSPDSTATN